MNNKKIKLIDCTLRDGGYYNNWNFNKKLATAYLHTMQTINVDCIEIGFVFLDNKKKLGLFSKINNNILNNLKLKNKNKLAVMINASDLLNKLNKVEFNKFLKEKLKVGYIRIACHKDELKKITTFIKILKKNKYKIAINLMQISTYTNFEIISAIKFANKIKINLLYFADSLGNLDQYRTEQISRIFKRYSKIEFGIHAHDNLGLALNNTLSAIKNGATWVDSTCLGMGRGPGNTKTEILYPHIKEENLDEKTLLLNNLIKNYFEPLKKKYLWGDNPLYFFSGINQIHPTYIQSILSDKRYSNKKELFEMVKILKNFDTKIFNPYNIHSAKNYIYNEPIGKCLPHKIIKNQEYVLIVGPGENLIKEKKKVEYFIKTKKPYVIALNNLKNISEKLISARAFCHPLRLHLDLLYMKSRSKIITPFSMFPRYLKSKVKLQKIYDFGLSLKDKNNKIGNKFCYLQKPLVIGYAILFAAMAKKQRIFLAGIDGYEDDKFKRKDVQLILDQIQSQFNIKIKSLTKNFLKIKTI